MTDFDSYLNDISMDYLYWNNHFNDECYNKICNSFLIHTIKNELHIPNKSKNVWNKQLVSNIINVHGNSTHDTKTLMFYLGLWYLIFNLDGNKAHEYLIKAIELGSGIAMFYLGYLCKCAGNDRDAIKYFEMAINFGNVDAMFFLGNYYYDMHDYENMLICYEKASIHHQWCSKSILNLANYYQFTNYDEKLLLKYYSLADITGEHLGKVGLYYYNKKKYMRYKSFIDLYNLSIKYFDINAQNKLKLNYNIATNALNNMMDYKKQINEKCSKLNSIINKIDKINFNCL